MPPSRHNKPLNLLPAGPTRPVRGVRLISFACVITASLTGTAQHAVADSSRAARPAAISVYFQGNPEAAFDELERRSRNGDAVAQYFAGRAWLRGHGTGIDRAVAYAWFAASDANGHWPGRQARRRLHSRLRVGELPRGERLARRFITRYSSHERRIAPCFSTDTHTRVTPCRPNWTPGEQRD